MATISVIILTKNEEENITRCLQSLVWCDEIIVIDDYSEDKTVVSCQLSVVRKKIKIFKRKLDGDFAAQRNYGLDKATSDWVLFVDVDEVVSKSLQQEIIKNLTKSSDRANCKGYFIRRKDHFLGRWLKYGETGNIKLLRLARKEAGKWKGKIHETWEVAGIKGELKNPLLHYPHPTITSFLTKINLYTDILAKKWYTQGKKVNFLSIILYPKGKFIQNYFLRLGFMDGIPGLIMAMMMSFHSFLARGKLWTRNNRKDNAVR